MGYSISWIAFKGLSKADVLARCGYREGGREDEDNESATSFTELPTGWSIVFSQDIDHGAAEHLAPLSSGATVAACQVEEHVMYSAVHCAVGGRILWSVRHVGEQGDGYDLSVDGTPPPELAPIKARLNAEQDAEKGFELNELGPQSRLWGLFKKFAGAKKTSPLKVRHWKVDYGFDIPVELAREITGYRHDRVEFDWGKPRFTTLVRQ
jgi:hypothetical protein